MFVRYSPPERPFGGVFVRQISAFARTSLVAALAFLQPLRSAPPVVLSGPPDPVRAGKPVTVTASLPAARAAEAVTFKIDGVFAGTAVLSRGQASLILGALPTGTHLVEVESPRGSARLPVTITPNTPAGGFRLAGTLPESSASHAVTADFNNDGHADLALGTKIFLGRGDGTFAPALEIPGHSEILAAADFNRDGITDLVTAQGILRGHGDGAFDPATASFEPGALQLLTGDFNADGDIDLAGLLPSGEILLWLGRGDGTLAAAVPALAVPGATSLAAGDLNADGLPDLIVTTPEGLSVFLGKGAGAFAPAVHYAAPAASQPLIADFDGDGTADVLLAGTSLTLLRGSGDGTLQPAETLLDRLSAPTALATADFDGDGRPDLALANCCAPAGLYLGAHPNATSNPTISGGSLPNGLVGQSYSYSFSASGGTAPYTFSSRGVPSGFSFSSTGTLSGTPSQAGVYPVQVAVTDRANRTAVATAQLTVYDKLRVSTTTLPPAIIGQSYSQSLAASGGLPSYTWEVVGGLPPGISLVGSSLSGTPTSPGVFVMNLIVTDATGQRANPTVVLQVTYPPLNLSINQPPNATVGVVFYAHVVQPSGGDRLYNFTFNGPPPPGLHFVSDNTAGIAGTPTTAGTYSFTVNVSDSSRNAATSGPVILTVTAAPKKPQTISFLANPAVVAVGKSAALGGASDSNLPITFTASPSGICSIVGAGAGVTLNAPGICTVTASQAGNDTYAAAVSVSQSVTGFTGAISPSSVTLTSPGVTSAQATITSNPPGLNYYVADTTSFLVVSYTYPTPGTLTFQALSGLKPGNYRGTVVTSLGSVDVTLTVAPPALKSQTILFTQFSNDGFVGETGHFTAKASSGLKITYSTASDSCTADATSGAVTYVHGGQCIVRASQPGDQTNWAPAPDAFFILRVYSSHLAILTTSLPPATVGIPYEATLTGQVAVGTAPAWGLDSGSLPNPLQLSRAGVISGTPTTAGTFAFRVSFSDFETKTAALSITVNPAATANLGASPSAVLLQATSGGPVVSQPINLNFATPATGAAPSWSATASAPWISLPTTGQLVADTAVGGLSTFSAGISVNGDPAGFTGTQNGSVTFTVAGSSVTVPVILSIAPAQLTLTPSTLSFTYRQGDPVPPALNALVSSQPAGLALSAAAGTASGGNWLSASVGASSPATMSVSLPGVALGTLGPGTYTGSVTITGPGAATAVLPVTLTVTPPPVAAVNTLAAVPSQLNFSGPAGGSPVTQTFTLSLASSAGGAPTWSASPAPPWLSFSPSSGSMTAGATVGGVTTYTATITAIGSPAILNANTPTAASVTFTAGGAQVAVPVAFSALQPAAISLSQPALKFSYTQGSATFPAAQNVGVSSSPSGISLHLAATATGGNWLSADDATGGGFITPDTLGVSVPGDAIASLSPGTYTGSVVVNGAGANTVILPVTLTVNPAAGSGNPVSTSTLAVAPSSLSFTAASTGGPLSQMVTLTLTTSAPSAPAWSFSSTAPWITTTPASGAFTAGATAGGLTTYTATFTVTANPAGLASGAQNGVGTFAVGSSTAALAVNMTISRPQQISVLYNAFVYSWRQGDPPPAALAGQVNSNPQGVPFTIAGTTTNGGSWLTVANVSPTPGTFTAGIDPDVLNTLAPGSYVGKLNLIGTGISLPVTLVVTPSDGPKINRSGVVPVYNTRTTIQPGSWISIYGDKLAPSTAVWNGDFPTSLNGVTVTVNGKPAYLWFVSPGQINVQAPDDLTQGPVIVAVTTPSGTTVATVGLAPMSPSFSLLDSRHVAAIAFNSDGSYSVVGPTGAFPYPTRPVAAGETLVLYGVGFGPTADPVPAGQLYASATPTTGPVPVTIGGKPAAVSFVGLVGSGLYQINVTVPEGLAPGDQPVAAMVGQFPSGAGPVVTIK